MLGFFRQCLPLQRRIVGKLNERLGQFGLSYSQWTVLYYVKNHGAAVLAEIAAHYGVKKPVITRSVQTLEAEQLVEQLPSRDRREKLIHLTAKGEEIYAAGRILIDELEQETLAGLPEAEVATLFAAMKTIRKNLQA
nr:MarR family transcriptional regulator [uncultured Anaeromusa sp.]